jgi:hypothetical protein
MKSSNWTQSSDNLQVELSLGTGIFIGCCMITGSLTAGFRTMLDTYLLEALASEGKFT